MSKFVRRALWIVVATQAIMAVGFAFQISPVIDLWPFTGRGPLTNLLIGSFFAAAAASTGWCLLTNSMRGLAGIGIDYVLVLVPLAVFSFVQAARGEGANEHLLVFATASALGAIFWTVLLAQSTRAQWRDARPTPMLVRWSFGLFVVLLTAMAGSLLWHLDALPWAVTDELSTVIAFLFLGSAAYFLYGLVEPRWENAGGQLAGFLAYDLVLLVPFLKRFPTVGDEFVFNLSVYTAVLVASAILAAHYLFLSSATRGRSPGVRSKETTLSESPAA